MKEINDRVASLIKYLESQYDSFDGSNVTVVFNPRLRSTAGRAFLETGVIELNQKLFNENKDAFMLDTIPHELAHIVAYQVFADKGHGYGWYSVMTTLGIEGKRCHSYKVEKTGKTYTYRCSCQTHEFTPQRHAWANKGKSYVCKHCKDILKFEG